MKSEERFVKVYTQGVMNTIEILVDKETGVNYLFRAGGYAGGLTPLLDSNGNVVITEYISEYDN